MKYNKYINPGGIGKEINSLNFVVKSSFRTFITNYGLRVRLLMPDLSFKVPYKTNNKKYYLYSGICTVSAIYNEKEYFIRIPQMYEKDYAFSGAIDYREFCKKFNYKENWGHCYSGDLHSLAIGFDNEKDMKDWFCQKFFNSYWAFGKTEQWEKFKKIDVNFMKYITCNFSTTYKKFA